MGQELTEIWTAQADLQPVLHKSDRLLGRRGSGRLLAAVGVCARGWLAGAAALLLVACQASLPVTVRDAGAAAGASAPLSLDGQSMIHLGRGDGVMLKFDTATERAVLPSGTVRYWRFMLDGDSPAVRISVHVVAQQHETEPRFTVLSPQLVLLGKNGGIRRVLPLDKLWLDIRPFEATQLRECVVVDDASSFLLTTDPTRLGQLYQFNARVAGSGSGRGFVRTGAPMQVFLTFADVGMVAVRVGAAPGGDTTCLDYRDDDPGVS